MNRKKVAVIAGGNASEEVISHRSAAQVFESLDRRLFDPYLVTLKGTEWRCQQQPVDLNEFSVAIDGAKVRFDYALIMIHGTPGENGILQGYFELMGIPYSTCDVTASALTFDKSLCKRALQGVQGVNLAREILLRRGDAIDPAAVADRLGLPLFVKPNASGSSFGVTKVKTAEGIEPAIQAALVESDAVLLEEYIAGREVSCGIMVVGGEEWVLPVTELITEREFFDFEAKYTPGLTREVTPADLPAEVVERLRVATRNSYHALGCRGVVRIDYIIREGIPYFIEVNTVPGMSAASIIPQQWREAGLSMTEAFTLIINETSK